MFYSHQLLARKEPLGQVWMAATMHEKMNRKKLDKLNIIKICEELLYPKVPMALRLSGILMGGVVIVYERKVKLLYDDVNRLLVELNEAWKIKAAPSDPTRLPKNKAQAKYEAVTLPKRSVEDLEEMEQSLPSVMGFQQTSYIAMRLDDPNLIQDHIENALNHDSHQVDAANITLLDNYDAYQPNSNLYDRFERFDIEGCEDFTPPVEHEIPTTLISTPPPPEEPRKADEIQEQHAADEIQEQHPEDKVHQQSNESKDADKVQIKRRAPRRPAKRAAHLMDYNHTVIPADVYQTWLREPSDVKRERQRKKSEDALSILKKDTLLELPSVVLSEKLFTSDMKIHYPRDLLQDWLKLTQPLHDSPSGRSSAPKPPEPSVSSLPEAMHFMGPMQEPFEDFNMGAGPQSPIMSADRQRAAINNNSGPPEILMEELRYNLRSKGLNVKEANGVGISKSNLMATPANSGDDIRSIHSSGSGNGLQSQTLNVNSGSKKRPFSASNISPTGLEPVAEELSWENPEFNFKIARVSGRDTPNDELMVETGPTQTQNPQTNSEQPLDAITDVMRKYLKAQFETPGEVQVESILNLASGMDKTRAARLFYQTCVLATKQYIKVQQKVPYGDILISPGAKM